MVQTNATQGKNQLIADDDDTPPSQKVSRRLVLGGLTAAGAVAAAGCQIGADGPEAGSNASGLEADPNIIDRISDRIATEVRALGDTPSRQQTMQTGARWAIYGSKIRGGNIVLKRGYQWSCLWSEWDWENWIKPQIDRAVALRLNSVRIIGAPNVIFKPDKPSVFPIWQAENDYGLEGMVRANGPRVYRLVVPGKSGSSGGPIGTGPSIRDGSAVWEYVRRNDLRALTQDEYDERWSQLIEYSSQQRLMVYACLCSSNDYNQIGLGDFRKPELTDSIVATAERIAKYSNVIALEVFSEGDLTTGATWQPNTEYKAPFSLNNDGKAYVATVAGTSAPSGGPTGTGSSINDGTVTWRYVGIPLLPDDVFALIAAIRAVKNIPIGMSSPGFNGGHPMWTGGSYKYLWENCLSDPRGPDFTDVHLGSPDVTAEVVARYAKRFGKPLMIGEFGPFPWTRGDWPSLVTSFRSVYPTHNLPGCMGSLLWGLAPQGPDDFYVWDAAGFVQANELHTGSPLSTTSGAIQDAVVELAAFAISQPIDAATTTTTSAPSISRTIQTITESVTLGAAGDYVVFIGQSGYPQLPTAVGNTGRYSIKNIDTENRAISTTQSETIDGSTTLDLPAGSTVELVSDGTNWRTL